jgi:phosphoglucosamine mutase
MTRHTGASAGVVISASHNPFEDNGIKVFSAQGRKLSAQTEEAIEKAVACGDGTGRARGAGIGRIRVRGDAVDLYARFCAATFPEGLDLKGRTIVLDCANGACSGVAPRVLAELGADVVSLGSEPDGVNINRGCGSQLPALAAVRTREAGAEAGFALDGDGDRVIAVDETGRTLTGDHTLAICARAYQQRGLLLNNVVVSTVMSNFGLGVALRETGIRQVVCRIGDRHVMEAMEEQGAVLGGEESGHTIFRNHHTTGDDLVTTLQILAAMRGSGERLSRLADGLRLTPQELIGVEVRERRPLGEIARLSDAIRAAEAELRDRGRVLVRYSGTQCVCRVMVEGPDAAATRAWCERLAEIVRREIGR